MYAPTDFIATAAAIDRAASALRAAGIENARAEAYELLMFSTGLRREDLIREPERSIGMREQLIFDKAVALRVQRRPLAYIIGERWFYGRPFKINRAVLIPRPETELLVEFAVEKAAGLPANPQVADIGAGSGCIGISVALEVRGAVVSATDISRLALLLAAKNVRRHGVSASMRLLEGDLLAPLHGEKQDLILSNPPYIAASDIAGLLPEVGAYEPPLALWEGAGEDGSEIHRRLIDDSRVLLNCGGWLAFEVGQGQAASMRLYAEQRGYKHVCSVCDYGGIERVVAAQWTDGE